MTALDATTLILLAGDRVVRADFASGAASPAAVFSAPRPRGATPAEAVRIGLAFAARPRRAVWVLSDEFWAQSVELNRAQITGLADEQIARALSFEIEPFSGIGVAESALGFQPTSEANGTCTFWIVEMTAADRDAIQRVVAAAGGRLAGIGHPGALPCALNGATDATWQRLEAWESGLLWVTSDAKRGVQARSVNALPARSALPASGAWEALATNGRSPVPDVAADLPWQRFSLQDEAALRLWLERWRTACRGHIPPGPIVPPAPLPPSARRHVLVAATLTLGTALICGIHAFTAQREKAALTHQSTELAAAAREQDNATKQTAALRQQLVALQSVADQNTRIAARRDSLPALLRALASNRPEDLVLRNIQAENPSSMTVSGLALDPASVDKMSQLLNAALRPAGWTAQPLQKTARHALTNGGPWEFSLRLTHDTAVAPARPKTKGGAR